MASGMMEYWFIATSNSYPQLEIHNDDEWRSLNYAIRYNGILVHSDIKLIPTT